MLSKSSKSLSRKELLLEYSKLRDLYEVQQMELRAKNEQILILVGGSGKRESGVQVDGNVNNPKFREDTLAAIEANIKERYETERQEMIGKLQQLHSINVRLVERLMLIQESKHIAEMNKDENHADARTDSVTPIRQSNRKLRLTAAMVNSAA